ncbi:MAG TPA: hypothetical protein VN736_26155 [Candidatus Limnocylindrales bacterium]|nr:hypothetical protein [Candidatus Limnocylindrales bacterium]
MTKELRTGSRQAGDPAPVAREDEQFGFPSFVVNPADSHAAVTEIEFFERFKGLVASRGFQYREKDLFAYHQNFKCSDFIILGGA